MMMGPEPMIITFLMSWRFGIESSPVFFQKRWQLRRIEIYLAFGPPPAFEGARHSCGSRNQNEGWRRLVYWRKL